ncbi:MAG: DUF4942 domain-containing protein [Armatimonadia bacterium]
MNAIVQSLDGELIDDSAEFFAPMSSDLIDSLIGQYKQERARIDQVAEVMAGELGGVVHYFIDGNKSERDGWYRLDKLFDPAGAIASLNSAYWQRALGLTDVLDCMPQKRRDEWHEQIRNKTAPDFEEDTVRSTIADMLASRSKFFAERVDGIFRALSGTHVTNRPEGFGKRMIISGVIDSYGSMSWSRSGYINDLRCIIAKFMGRDEPKHGATDGLIKRVRQRNGEWADIDGGALRMRIYNGAGTAHLEVHPDMAWRLNGVLASLYPMAIPPKFRERPKKAPKEHRLMQRPLPFAVVGLLASATEAREKVDDFRNPWRNIPRTRAICVYDADKGAMAEAERVLEAIGGVRDKIGNQTLFRFDYEPQAVLDEIVCSGCIPDDKSHQFYPTPEGLAAKVVQMAHIQPGMKCLEPSAGTGAIADHMPVDATHCIEVSELRASILEAKGFAVTQGDFLSLASVMKPLFDRVVMNPPFSEGRWQAHLQAAAGLVKSGGKGFWTGRLVAILPASAKGKDLLPGWDCDWYGPFDNQFAGTSVSVVILTADRVE